MASALLDSVRWTLPAGKLSFRPSKKFSGTIMSASRKDNSVVQREISRPQAQVSPVRTKPQEESQGFLGGLKEKVLTGFVDLWYREIDETVPVLENNFGPVSKTTELTRVEVIEGKIPQDFPQGTYVRNGPNPYFFPKTLKNSVGKSRHHWFEGDGMLHGTCFENGEAYYANDYVMTEGLKQEIERGRRLHLPTVDCDQKNMIANALLNQARFGVGNKVTANTSVVYHHGKVFALQEGGLPYQVTVPDLKTIGTENFGGKWNRAFTAHPKVCPETGEMIIYGYEVEKPYVVLAVLSAEGKLLHKTDLGMERATFLHDIAITTKYNVIMDLPLTFDKERLGKGKSLIDFESDSYARIGIMPRLGDTKSIRWFEIDLCYAFHTMNAFEDGDEVVLHALRQRIAYLKAPEGISTEEFWQKGITPSPENPSDPLAGSLDQYLYEWRLNLKTGEVFERPLVGLENPGDFPRINDNYMGRKYEYGYAAATNVEACVAEGLPKAGGIYKYHIPQSKDSPTPVKIEYHSFGDQRFGSEPVFVARPNPKSEDDGWVVTYVHDENINESEMYIVDAQAFESKPDARIKLPQRVPYGFHGAFIPSS